MKRLLAGFLCLLFLCIVGCGGSGSSSPTVSGTASQGSAIASGSPVILTDSTGKIARSAVGANGSYNVTVSGLTKPFFLNCSSLSGNHYYSFASDAGTTNINPFTHLSVQAVLGSTPITSVTPGQITTLSSSFLTAVSNLKTALAGLYPSSVTASTDFIAGNITIGDGVDKVFDSITIIPPNASGVFSIAVGSTPIINGTATTFTPTAAISTANSTIFPDVTISGQVTVGSTGLSGATVTLTGSGSTSTKTDTNGNFSFGYVQNGSYTLSASMAGYTMSANQAVSVTSTSVTGINFTATATPSNNVFTTAMISGKTYNYSDTQGNSGTPTFNANGNYTVSNGDSGTWNINSSGQLILVEASGGTDTLTLTANTGTVITASDLFTHSDGTHLTYTVTLTTVAASTTTFSQADLTGTWNFLNFATGPDVTSGNYYGWKSGNATVDSAGNVTINSALDSTGSTSTNINGAIKWSANSDGTINETGTASFDSSRLKMSSNKTIIIGVASNGADRLMRIAVKQNGTTFSSADFAGPIQFVGCDIDSGPDNDVTFMNGNITNGSATITSTVSPTGNTATVKAQLLPLISSTGVISTPNSCAILTPDKKLMFKVTTWGTNSYDLSVSSFQGQSFTQSDLAGNMTAFSIAGPASPLWQYITYNVSGSLATATSNLYSDGSTSLTGENVSGISISSSGLITASSNTTANGFMSYDKKLIVIDSQWDTNQFGLALMLK